MCKETIDSIIFDLDGTMWDSSDVIVQVWNDTAKKFKEINTVITKEKLKSVVGIPVLEIGKKVFPYLPEDKVIEFVACASETESKCLASQGGILFQGLEDTIKDLSKRYKLFIVSNCHHGYIESFFTAHNMGNYFTDFEHPGNTGLHKGENIKLIIERNKLKNSIYVGDTAGDQKAAKVAEIPFVYAKYGFGDVKDYDYSIDKFEDLLKLEIN